MFQLYFSAPEKYKIMNLTSGEDTSPSILFEIHPYFDKTVLSNLAILLAKLA